MDGVEWADRFLGISADDIPTTTYHYLDRPDGTHQVIAMTGSSINEIRRRWRKNFLEPHLLAVLRARLAQLGGMEG
jgi:hypothetical protein